MWCGELLRESREMNNRERWKRIIVKLQNNGGRRLKERRFWIIYRRGRGGRGRADCQEWLGSGWGMR